MSNPQLRITRDLSVRTAGNWSGRRLCYGELLWRYDGDASDCVTPTGIACSDERGEPPFFELPRNAVELVDESNPGA